MPDFRSSRTKRRARDAGLAMAIALALGACGSQDALVLLDVTVDKRAISYQEAWFSADVAGARAIVVGSRGDGFRLGYYLAASPGPVRIRAEARGEPGCVLGEGETTIETALKAGATVKGGLLAIAFKPSGTCTLTPPIAPMAVEPPDAGPTAGAEAGPEVDREPPTIVSFSPANGALEVDRGAVIVIKFSERITLVPDAIQVTSGEKPVAGALLAPAPDGQTARFLPSGKLPMGATIVVTVAALSDEAGNPLAGIRSASFITVDGAWTKPEPIDEHDNEAARGSAPTNVAIAADSQGNALVAWEKFASLDRPGGPGSPLTSSVHVARFTAGVGWGKSVVAASNPLGQATNPQLALDDGGRAILLTDQKKPGIGAASGASVMASIFDPAEGWSTPALQLDRHGEGRADGGHLARLPSGDALATWIWWPEVGEPAVEAVRFIMGRPGLVVFRLDRPPDPRPPTSRPHDAASALDPAGNAIAVWSHTVGSADGASGAIWASRATVLDGWGTPIKISPKTEFVTGAPRVAMDAAGNAMVTWAQVSPDFVNLLMSASFKAATVTWAPPTVIFTGRSGDLSADAPAVAMNARGATRLAFPEATGLSLASVVDGVVAKESIGRNNRIDDVDLGVDDQGRGAVVWQESDRVMVARESAPGRAGAPIQLNVAPAFRFQAQLEVLPDGRVFVVWLESAKPDRLMSARFE